MLSHVDDQNRPRMVDVGAKPATQRSARARCRVILGAAIMARLQGGDIVAAKGPVFQTAIVAGTMACKRTSDLIPFCHPLALDHCQISIAPADAVSVQVECRASLTARTGVEMEALTGAAVAALTIYDMCKAMSHDIVISDLQLVEKHGGKHDVVRA